MPMPSASTALPLASYRAAIALDEPFRPSAPPAAADHLGEAARIALRALAHDAAIARLGLSLTDVNGFGDADARRLLRALLTVRAAEPLPEQTAQALDALLGGERLTHTTVDARRLPSIGQEFPGTPYSAADRTVLWLGDITTLGADAIVNAANSALLGCFRPQHPCVDNAIHNAAGPRLREDCHTIMSLQNASEPVGTAKLTRGYHLPARYVLHTVGPIVDGPVRPSHEQDLAAAYRSCLDLASEIETIRTVSFCGISTGVFGFPKAPAARVALRTVADWTDAHPGRLDRVVFNVFSEDDRAVYLNALTEAL
ncbi:protein-ADP-ribose hydrolase [Streptomyces sp. NPDC002513]